MANYLYFQQADLPLNERFRSLNDLTDEYRVDGLADWQELIALLLNLLRGDEREGIRLYLQQHIRELEGGSWPGQTEQGKEGRTTAELVLVFLLLRLRRRYQTLPADRCQRVFISHRQSDKNIALRMAQLAESRGFAYWVDVLDPSLAELARYQTRGINFHPLLTACIIEMALINCTHILACITPKTYGTMWVPYEYGRLTNIPGTFDKASAWLHPAISRFPIPEYLLFGQITHTELEITNWLDSQQSPGQRQRCQPTDPQLDEYILAGLPLTRNITVRRLKLKNRNP